MKNFKSYYFHFIILALLIVSCSKDDDLSEHHTIIGQWNWVKTLGGFSGIASDTPESTGYTRTYIFTHEDTVIVLFNRDTVLKTDYFLSTEESVLFKEEFDFLTINHKYLAPDLSTSTLPERYMIKSLNDSLILQEDLYDGFEHIYIKSK
ncbi:hypothetical protein [Marinifilum caeruleilacunae]|uniref:Lipocalin-like domain-containing protein n=1 Tax=Marinifilum caeruleilacunae TaxID=2499076 RepID=A0ABX1X0Z1_9BACT|nr:hypothetical protein [Marinifilum caeruleilacunae]NOU61974.1 hypothetical protein [Marinifilum caeruleilacunae]